PTSTRSPSTSRGRRSNRGSATARATSSSSVKPSGCRPSFLKAGEPNAKMARTPPARRAISRSSVSVNRWAKKSRSSGRRPRTAALDDRLTTFYATSSVRLPDGEELPFFTAQSVLGREPDARRRELLGDASEAVMVEADDLALELMKATQEVIGGFGYDSYVRFWSELKGVDYIALQAELERVASACRERYRAWIEPRMEAAGTRFDECTRGHLSYFRG